ncbi:MAG: hypothetical protein ACO3OV_02315 [Steroidobacteraceae bacterium]
MTVHDAQNLAIKRGRTGLRVLGLTVLGVAIGVGIASANESSQQTSSSMGLTESHPQFCAEVQQLLVPTELAITNVIEPDYDAFKLSKPQADPLITHQFLNPNGKWGLTQISCKTKSADHLRAIHGPTVTPALRDPRRADRSCRDVHRAMALAIWRQASPEERAAAPHPPSRLMLDADLAYMTWASCVPAPAEAYLGADRRLHLRAVTLFAGWDDWRWKIMPEIFRGNHYCHLIAPESLRELMLNPAAQAALR